MTFELREETVRSIIAAGRSRGATVGPPAAAGPPLDLEEMVALFGSSIPTDRLREAAIARRGVRATQLETFSPLYLTNTCDAECRMCGMRRDNVELERETASPAEVYRQLRLL
ncbi:MAG: hypothetical protein ACREQY_15835, partial [Candidatus Binatia bacterium]